MALLFSTATETTRFLPGHGSTTAAVLLTTRPSTRSPGPTRFPRSGLGTMSSPLNGLYNGLTDTIYFTLGSGGVVMASSTETSQGYNDMLIAALQPSPLASNWDIQRFLVDGWISSGVGNSVERRRRVLSDEPERRGQCWDRDGVRLYRRRHYFGADADFEPT